ncbi:MAG: hypothetical protein ACP5IJ_01425 [Candidatus Nanoarchaeia archaeon]
MANRNQKNRNQKKIFFDSSTLISMALSCSLPLFEKLAKHFDGAFYITDSVYRETVERAMQSLKFRYEGYRIKSLIEAGLLKFYSEKNIKSKIQSDLDLLNRLFIIYGKPLNIVQIGEISAIAACAQETNSNLAVDERTARMLIENVDGLVRWLSEKFHARVEVNKNVLSTWQQISSKIPICIRSAELAVAAWEAGMLESLDQLYGLLWALKFSGCAITENEINNYIKLLKR